VCVAPTDLWFSVGEAEGSPAFCSKLLSAAGHVPSGGQPLSAHGGNPQREGSNDIISE